MISVLLRDSIRNKIINLLNKYNKEYYKFDPIEEVKEECTDNGVKLQFGFILLTHNILGLVDFFNKYFYSVSKCNVIKPRAVIGNECVYIFVDIVIDNEMIDTILQ